MLKKYPLLHLAWRSNYKDKVHQKRRSLRDWDKIPDMLGKAKRSRWHLPYVKAYRFACLPSQQKQARRPDTTLDNCMLTIIYNETEHGHQK